LPSNVVRETLDWIQNERIKAASRAERLGQERRMRNPPTIDAIMRHHPDKTDRLNQFIASLDSEIDLRISDYEDQLREDVKDSASGQLPAEQSS
jgi:hypothetical protein